MDILLVLLSESGYTNVFTAKNETEALKIFSENSKVISLILLDMNMKVMGGFQFITQLKNILKYPVGIIGMTGAISEENKEIFYKAGSETI